uniref:Uncharacterized protein n=1 Tax=Oryza glumipatula TaxID=40148 RepID=A0A0D9Y872_9ORYZ
MAAVYFPITGDPPALPSACQACAAYHTRATAAAAPTHTTCDGGNALPGENIKRQASRRLPPFTLPLGSASWRFVVAAAAVQRLGAEAEEDAAEAEGILKIKAGHCPNGNNHQFSHIILAWGNAIRLVGSPPSRMKDAMDATAAERARWRRGGEKGRGGEEATAARVRWSSGKKAARAWWRRGSGGEGEVELGEEDGKGEVERRRAARIWGCRRRGELVAHVRQGVEQDRTEEQETAAELSRPPGRTWSIDFLKTVRSNPNKVPLPAFVQDTLGTMQAVEPCMGWKEQP